MALDTEAFGFYNMKSTAMATGSSMVDKGLLQDLYPLTESQLLIFIVLIVRIFNVAQRYWIELVYWMVLLETVDFCHSFIFCGTAKIFNKA